MEFLQNLLSLIQDQMSGNAVAESGDWLTFGKNWVWMWTSRWGGSKSALLSV